MTRKQSPLQELEKLIDRLRKQGRKRSADLVNVSGQVCLDFTLRVPRDTTDRQLAKMLRTMLEFQAVIGVHSEELTTEWHLPVPWEIQEDGRTEPKKAKRTRKRK